jgi:hypothetical protein
MRRELLLCRSKQLQLRSDLRESFSKRSMGQHRLYYSQAAGGDGCAAGVSRRKVSQDMASRHSVTTPR